MYVPETSASIVITTSKNNPNKIVPRKLVLYKPLYPGVFLIREKICY